MVVVTRDKSLTVIACTAHLHVDGTPVADLRPSEQIRLYLEEGKHFAKGSMAPKIQAAIWYLENGGRHALITNPENIGRALKGEAGTWISG